MEPGTMRAGRAPASNQRVGVSKDRGSARRSSGASFLVEVDEGFANDFGVGDEGENSHPFPAPGAIQRIELVGDRFILHLVQRFGSRSCYLPVAAASFSRLWAWVDRSGADQRAIGRGVESLSPLLTDASTSVRREAIEALSYFSHPRAEDMLFTRFDDPDVNARYLSRRRVFPVARLLPALLDLCAVAPRGR